MYRIVVRAGISELRAVPVWRNLMQLGLRVGEWRIRMDRELNAESLSIDLLDPPATKVNELRSRLQLALPSVLSIDVRELVTVATTTRLRL